MDEIEFLATVSQLTGLERTDLEAIHGGMAVQRFGAGDLILEEASSNDSFHVIRQGRVRVSRRVDDRDVTLCDLLAGQTFGELSILGNGIVTATLRAIGDVTIYSLSMDSLDGIFRQSPRVAAKFWQAIATDLRDRLVQTNDVVRNYFEVNRALIENETFREAYAMCTR